MLGTALAIGQGLYGLYNASQARKQADEYQAKMEKMAKSSPLQTQSPELANYYQQALNRYNENPFTTPYYLESIKQANRGAANAIGAMQSRGSAIGTIGRINQGLMDNSNRAIGSAVQNKNQQFSQLGSATQMKKSERDQMFDINQMTPYNRMLQLQQLKTQAANDRYNAGLSMAAQGVSSLGQLDIAKQMYPNGADNSNANKGSGSLFSNIFGNKAAKYAKLSDAASKSNLDTLNNIQDKYRNVIKYIPQVRTFY
jgi:hypothetical protein